MFEMIFAAILVMMVFVFVKGHPIIKHYRQQVNLRLELAKKHTRLFKARNDLLVRVSLFTGSLDALRLDDC